MNLIYKIQKLFTTSFYKKKHTIYYLKDKLISEKNMKWDRSFIERNFDILSSKVLTNNFRKLDQNTIWMCRDIFDWNVVLMLHLFDGDLYVHYLRNNKTIWYEDKLKPFLFGEKFYLERSWYDELNTCYILRFKMLNLNKQIEICILRREMKEFFNKGAYIPHTIIYEQDKLEAFKYNVMSLLTEMLIMFDFNDYKRMYSVIIHCLAETHYQILHGLDTHTFRYSNNYYIIGYVSKTLNLKEK